MASTIDSIFPQFYKLGGSASLLELRMRLLADKVEATRSVSSSKSISEAEEAIIDHFVKLGTLSEGESKLLTTARKIRNKFLHGEFRTAISILEDHRGRPFTGKMVLVLNAKGLSPQETMDALSGNSKGPNALIPITHATGDSDRLFGWLLQATAVGSLKEAEELLIQANAIVQRITEQT